MTPEELWKQAINGHQPSWQRLYELFGASVYQFFYRNTRSAELAADKTQEVFLRIYKSREAFTGGSLKSWIFRIAKNLLIDEWRKSGQREVLTGEFTEPADENAVVEDEVLASIEREQMKALVDEALVHLDADSRMLICLVYLGGLSLPELAGVMELPLGTAKTRVRHARLKLDALLREKIQIKSTGKQL